MKRLSENQILAICTVASIITAILCACYALHKLQL